MRKLLFNLEEILQALILPLIVCYKNTKLLYFDDGIF